MTAMTETSGMVQITNRLIFVTNTLEDCNCLENTGQGGTFHCITIVIIIIICVFKILNRVEPGNFRIGRVGRAHNDYYEVALKDR